MFGLIWSLSARIHTFLRRTMPTNILIAAIMTRRGLKWGVPAMLLVPAHVFGAVVFISLPDQDAPKWLYLLALVCLWNAFKFAVVGPVSLVRLAHVRILEARARRAAVALVASEGVNVVRTEGDRVGATA
ncbi:sulfate permease [Microbacterium sp. C7(2022)]|uniref:sulfate permease n=1 Tax=Microbacterium sp. C7(2022) TaxID=2992759 RepID=UPI00237ADED5|nr:sulfate permease [Microbacterium sp. C7(2022)]MDE0545924.1 sulfate permease [Microbacterium sp. C7(2022)]